MYPVLTVEENTGGKCKEKKNNLEPLGYGYNPNESDDELLDDILVKNPPPYQENPVTVTKCTVDGSPNDSSSNT